MKKRLMELWNVASEDLFRDHSQGFKGSVLMASQIPFTAWLHHLLQISQRQGMC